MLCALAASQNRAALTQLVGRILRQPQAEKTGIQALDERHIAVYLDGEAALIWWHRNVARQQYGLQGWRRGHIYPDFIFALQRAEGQTRILALETKGDQLAGNLDTTYKQAVLRLMSEHYAIE